MLLNTLTSFTEGVEAGRVGRIDPGLLPAPEITGGAIYRQVYDGGLRSSRGGAPVQMAPEYETRGIKSSAPGRNRRREGELATALDSGFYGQDVAIKSSGKGAFPLACHSM